MKWSKANDVIFLAIDSYKGEKADGVKKYLEENKLNLTVIMDKDQKLAAKFSATNATQTFVMDQDGKLRYRGAFDNREDENSKKYVNYVIKAAEQLKNDEEVSTPETEPVG